MPRSLYLKAAVFRINGSFISSPHQGNSTGVVAGGGKEFSLVQRGAGRFGRKLSPGWAEEGERRDYGSTSQREGGGRTYLAGEVLLTAGPAGPEEGRSAAAQPSRRVTTSASLNVRSVGTGSGTMTANHNVAARHL